MIMRLWATRITSLKRQGCDVFVYFDNDQKSAAPADALRLQELLGQISTRQRVRSFGIAR